MAIATWFDIGASLILAGINAALGLALIGLSLSLLLVAILLTYCGSSKAALAYLPDGKQNGRVGHGS